MRLADLLFGRPLASGEEGVREPGVVFILPTYLFVGSFVVVIAVDLVKMMASGGSPPPEMAPPLPPAATVIASTWLLLRAFASPCTAMTDFPRLCRRAVVFVPIAAR